MSDIERHATTLRARLVDELSATRAITDPAWRSAFLAVPRHRFVPAFQCRTPDGRQTLTASDDAEQWLAGVYRNDSLVTTHLHGVATSSSTEPALMAIMLEALELEEGHQVLEIGTGTGYNAALLCARLGDSRVTSVEVDPRLAEAATAALADLGYRPRIRAGDGLAGYPEHAPFDRIIATCSTSHLPPAWLAQTRPGGIILANLGYGLARLHRYSDGSASGRFLPATAAFIEARPADVPPALPVPAAITLATSNDGDQRAVTAPEVIDEAELWFITKLLLPTVARVTLQLDEAAGRRRLCLVDPVTSSWARADLTGDNGTLHQGGPRRLWDELEQVVNRWQASGRPTHHQLRITINPQGHHQLWTSDSGEPLATWQGEQLPAAGPAQPAPACGRTSTGTGPSGSPGYGQTTAGGG